MTSVTEHLQRVDGVIFSNIEALVDDRGLLSQNVLAQLRNLVEGVAVLAHTKDASVDYNYAAIEAGLAFLGSNGKLSFLSRFYRQLQPSASHYTFDGDSTERLMLKYFAYLYRARDLLRKTFGPELLANLEIFPIDLTCRVVWLPNSA